MIRKNRRDVARILTILNERSRAAKAAPRPGGQPGTTMTTAALPADARSSGSSSPTRCRRRSRSARTAPSATRSYGKYLKRSTIYKAHDEDGPGHDGRRRRDRRSRVGSRKTKRWRLVRVVRKGKAEAVRGEEDREAVATRPIAKPAPAVGDRG